MKPILQKLLECLLTILPFLRKKDAKELKEFSDLVMSQYTFLIEQVEKVLKDYFKLSDKVTEMHSELFRLREEVLQAQQERCSVHNCSQRS